MRSLLIPIVLFFAFTSFSQTQDAAKWRDEILSDSLVSKTDSMAEASKYSLGPVWTTTDNAITLGFIGKNYQRIRIKLITAVKSGDKAPNTYAVSGASLVNKTFRRFNGTIRITHFRYLNPEADPAVQNEFAEKGAKKRGILFGDYTFTEEGKGPHTGVFTGILYSAFYIDAKDVLHYDDLELGADGFANNQFVGTWTSSDGKLSLACNWGDARIPLSGPLDVGDGEFSPAKEFIKYGWQSYVDAYFKSPQDEKALAEQSAKWWER
ncbi:MAG: hypothetical protein UZ17_ACD001000628 [Acidobacteria bacterium OLB17]|nr:MAG: hypothetical protein UZ17_ACD001000628 [Acidobacteria bacterium OLB17]MCZ2390579.1 hypothetical protein [Acidobacteriota bacterium]